MKDIQDRALGAMLGLAIGDAMGMPVEFRPKGTFKPVTGFRNGGPFKLKAGEWTDDTAMALCLAQSLIDCQGMDVKDQMDKYLKWVDEGYMSCTGQCVGMGQTVLRALSRYHKTGDPYQGDPNPKHAGSGCIMRLAPVPIYFHKDAKSAILESVNSARVTHGSLQALQCSAYFAGLIWAALNGYSKEEILKPFFTPCSEFQLRDLHEDVDRVLSGSYKSITEEKLKPTGYVVDSLEVALWGIHNFDSYSEGLFAVVNLGGDSDTAAAIYGQLAGAHYGSRGLPEELLEKLADVELIKSLAHCLISSNK